MPGQHARRFAITIQHDNEINYDMRKVSLSEPHFLSTNQQGTPDPQLNVNTVPFLSLSHCAPFCVHAHPPFCPMLTPCRIHGENADMSHDISQSIKLHFSEMIWKPRVEEL